MKKIFSNFLVYFALIGVAVVLALAKQWLAAIVVAAAAAIASSAVPFHRKWHRWAIVGAMIFIALFFLTDTPTFTKS